MIDEDWIASHLDVRHRRPHLLELCHDEGTEVVALADSTGSIWSP